MVSASWRSRLRTRRSSTPSPRVSFAAVTAARPGSRLPRGRKTSPVSSRWTSPTPAGSMFCTPTESCAAATADDVGDDSLPPPAGRLRELSDSSRGARPELPDLCALGQGSIGAVIAAIPGKRSGGCRESGSDRRRFTRPCPAAPLPSVSTRGSSSPTTTAKVGYPLMLEFRRGSDLRNSALRSERSGAHLLDDTGRALSQPQRWRVLGARAATEQQSRRRGAFDPAGFDALLDADRDRPGVPAPIARQRRQLGGIPLSRPAGGLLSGFRSHARSVARRGQRHRAQHRRWRELAAELRDPGPRLFARSRWIARIRSASFTEALHRLLPDRHPRLSESRCDLEHARAFTRARRLRAGGFHRRSQRPATLSRRHGQSLRAWVPGVVSASMPARRGPRCPSASMFPSRRTRSRSAAIEPPLLSRRPRGLLPRRPDCHELLSEDSGESWECIGIADAADVFVRMAPSPFEPRTLWR